MKYVHDEVHLHSIPISTKVKETKLDYTVNIPTKNIENFKVEYALHNKKKMRCLKKSFYGEYQTVFESSGHTHSVNNGMVRIYVPRKNSTVQEHI
jgi:hypothetical protein